VWTDLFVQIVAGLAVLAIAGICVRLWRRQGSNTAHAPQASNRAPNWTSDEFETLLSNPGLSDVELSRVIGTRTAGAVGVVREGIHAYHHGKDPGILNRMMKDRLAGKSKSVRCPKCGATV
jgi:hypothetical protein